MRADKHLICIAGGSGVTPFRGFVREATRRKLETEITILYSVRTTNDIIATGEEFRQLEQENPNFNFYVTCTRLSAGDPWPGRPGGLMRRGSRSTSLTCRTRFLAACGPNELVEGTRNVWSSNGLRVPKHHQMLVEKWG